MNRSLQSSCISSLRVCSLQRCVFPRACTAHLNRTTRSSRTSESRTRKAPVVTSYDARHSTTSTLSDFEPSIEHSLDTVAQASTFLWLEDDCRDTCFSYETSCEPLQAVFTGSPTPTRTSLISANHTWTFTSASGVFSGTRLFDPSFAWARELPCFDYVCDRTENDTQANLTAPHQVPMLEPAWASCGAFWNMINDPPRSKPVALNPAETIVVPTLPVELGDSIPMPRRGGFLSIQPINQPNPFSSRSSSTSNAYPGPRTGPAHLPDRTEAADLSRQSINLPAGTYTGIDQEITNPGAEPVAIDPLAPSVDSSSSTPSILLNDLVTTLVPHDLASVLEAANTQSQSSIDNAQIQTQNLHAHPTISPAPIYEAVVTAQHHTYTFYSQHEQPEIIVLGPDVTRTIAPGPAASLGEQTAVASGSALVFGTQTPTFSKIGDKHSPARTLITSEISIRRDLLTTPGSQTLAIVESTTLALSGFSAVADVDTLSLRSSGQASSKSHWSGSTVTSGNRTDVSVEVDVLADGIRKLETSLVRTQILEAVATATGSTDDIPLKPGSRQTSASSCSVTAARFHGRVWVLAFFAGIILMLC